MSPPGQQQFPRSTAQLTSVKDVFPILESRCFVCHGPELQQSELRLDAKSVVIKGGASGPVLKPGTAEESPLFLRVAAREGYNVMPPVGERLAPRELGLIRAWINQGAEWPEGVGAGVWFAKTN